MELLFDSELALLRKKRALKKAERHGPDRWRTAQAGQHHFREHRLDREQQERGKKRRCRERQQYADSGY